MLHETIHLAVEDGDLRLRGLDAVGEINDKMSVWKYGAAKGSTGPSIFPIRNGVYERTRADRDGIVFNSYVDAELARNRVNALAEILDKHGLYQFPRFPIGADTALVLHYSDDEVIVRIIEFSVWRSNDVEQRGKYVWIPRVGFTFNAGSEKEAVRVIEAIDKHIKNKALVPQDPKPLVVPPPVPPHCFHNAHLAGWALDDDVVLTSTVTRQVIKLLEDIEPGEVFALSADESQALSEWPLGSGYLWRKAPDGKIVCVNREGAGPPSALKYGRIVDLKTAKWVEEEVDNPNFKQARDILQYSLVLKPSDSTQVFVLVGDHLIPLWSSTSAPSSLQKVEPNENLILVRVDLTIKPY